MIQTNQMQIQFFYEAIRKDFVLYQIRKENGNYYKSQIPDIARQLGHCLSVVYQKGSSCYALFPAKGHLSVRRHLKEQLESIEPQVTVQLVDPATLYHNELAQLLCNAIPMLQNPDATYANTQGKLYRLIPGKMKYKKGKLESFSALCLQFDWNCCLSMKVQSFTDRNLRSDHPELPQFLFDPESTVLRRAFAADKALSATRFIPRARSAYHKTTVPFLSFDNLENYRACKVGILHSFLQDVDSVLAPYMRLSPLPIQEGAHYIPQPAMVDTMESTRKRLAGLPFYLEDTLGTPESAALSALIRKELSQYSHVQAQTDPPAAGSVLLRVIHNQAWYAEHSEPDPHVTRLPGHVLQHVTLEDFRITGISRRTQKEKEDAALKKVLLEIAIKLDIQAGQLSVYPWQSLGLSEPFHFVTATPGQEKGPLCCKRLTILPDGHMQFDRWQEDSLHKDGRQHALTDAFLTEKGTIDPNIEGLFYLGDGPIYKIQGTERYTLPNMEALERALHATVDAELLDTAPIREVILDLLPTAADKQKSAYHKILADLNSLGDTATRKEIRGVLHLKGAAGQAIHDAYFTRSGVKIANGIRQKKNFETYFGATLDIRWYPAKQGIFFFSGNKSEALGEAFAHACRVRKLTALDDSDCAAMMQQILPLLAVDFVSASGWTVLPFPFKYLREYSDTYSNAQMIVCPE